VSLVDVVNTGLELVADRNGIYDLMSPMDQSVGKKRIDPRGSANMSICIDAFAAPKAEVVYGSVSR
jgi:hypothetical protein